MARVVVPIFPSSYFGNLMRYFKELLTILSMAIWIQENQENCCSKVKYAVIVDEVKDRSTTSTMCGCLIYI